MANKAAPTTNHPLEGMITTLYLDPLTRKQKEGRAKVIEVLSSKPADKTQDLYDCVVHFIGDRRGYNVKRQLVMRRATIA